MMQIPPPSPPSLLSEMFNRTGDVNIDNDIRESNESKYNRNPIEKQQQQQQQHQQHQYSSSIYSTKVRYQIPLQQRQRQGEQRAPLSRHASRRRSPSLKIQLLRNTTTSSSTSLPDKDDNGNGNGNGNRGREERDENGIPRLPASGPLTCFSYRTMEKEYEKDTLRMLERIRNSRSFERSKRKPSTALIKEQHHHEHDAVDVDDSFESLDNNNNDNSDREEEWDVDDDNETAGSCSVSEPSLRTESYGDFEYSAHEQSFEDGEDEIFELDL